MIEKTLHTMGRKLIAVQIEGTELYWKALFPHCGRRFATYRRMKWAMNYLIAQNNLDYRPYIKYGL